MTLTTQDWKDFQEKHGLSTTEFVNEVALAATIAMSIMSDDRNSDVLAMTFDFGDNGYAELKYTGNL